MSVSNWSSSSNDQDDDTAWSRARLAEEGVAYRVVALVMRFQAPRATVLLYRSGKFVVIGATSVADAKLAAEKLISILKYEPELFPGLIYRMLRPKCTLLIFISGKIVITGCEKKMVVISARVHPAETPANFMLDGILQLLLHPTDESAIALRRNFVFKIVPMLNPDGVCQGFYRTDTRGVNLNRVYEDPQPELAPTVFALKNLLLELVKDYGGADSISASENMVYLDLHAHANRRGCFIFGNNHLPDMLNVNNEAMEKAMARQVQTQLYARLVGLHTPFFDYMACLFDKDSMTKHDLRDNSNATTSRQGSSRVALYRATGLTYVYTIECNYNEGRRNLRTSTVMPSSSTVDNTGPAKRCSSLNGSTKSIQPDRLRIPRRTAPTSTRLYLKYSPADWRDVGIGAIIALLDLFELPGAGQRIEDSSFRSRDGIMKNLLAEIRAATPGEALYSAKPSKNRQRIRQIVKQQTRVNA
ncbi:hypothetical protein AM588_10006465 [Phytophthora nicotianae]|uniref:Peptidase M14 domain-containing protein n=1 Tax=Phytophthora nicotianae TaxID=4792 RepID=A0A0W8DKW3_PHYNI|nr:hypothetical protein AM588_10006465 [Phytophthora nicotianae]